jgi:hypothetical protein
MVAHLDASTLLWTVAASTVHGAVAHVKPAALREVLPPAGHEIRAAPCAVNPAGHLKSHPPPAATEGWHALASTLGLMVLAVTVHGAAGWAGSASRCSSYSERHIIYAVPGLFCQTFAYVGGK